MEQPTGLLKDDFVEMTMNKIGCGPEAAEKIVTCFFSSMKERLEKGEEIKIAGFGRWKTAEKKARIGRNPQTGESLTIGARSVVRFKVSGRLKKELNSD